MLPQGIRVSARMYRWLLGAYPPAYRRRFAGEMGQVFSLLCRDCYERSGLFGLAGLWLPALWDWAWTAAGQWIRCWVDERRLPMYAGLDQQLGDLTWSIATGLRAGYSLRQVFEALVAEAPEPAASACRRLLAELDQGLDFNAALASWQHAIPSTALARLAEALQQPAQSGAVHSDVQSGSLANSLDPLSEELLRECGSDPAFYAPMRREAEQLGAKTPERALHTID